MTTVRLPDGRLIKNVPEGTTKADLMAKLGLSPEQVQPANPEPAADPYAAMGQPEGMSAPQGPNWLERNAEIPLGLGGAVAGASLGSSTGSASRTWGSGISLMLRKSARKTRGESFTSRLRVLIVSGSPVK